MHLMKSTAAALALTFAALSAPAAISTAEAGHKNWHGKRVVEKRVVIRKPGVRFVGGRYWYGGRYYDHDAALAAGLLGFAAGAIVGGALAAPAPVVVAPAPRYVLVPY